MKKAKNLTWERFETKKQIEKHKKQEEPHLPRNQE